MLDYWEKRAGCLTLSVFLITCDVSVLWLVLMELRVGLHSENKRAGCLTPTVTLMPCDVSVLWFVLMVLKVGLHCGMDGTRELVA